jgi:threonine synthase
VVPLSEDELRDTWSTLARVEGVFCEPASAAGIAALTKLGRGGISAVCIVTGHGLKDAGAVDSSTATVVDASLDAVLEALA